MYRWRWLRTIQLVSNLLHWDWADCFEKVGTHDRNSSVYQDPLQWFYNDWSDRFRASSGGPWRASRRKRRSPVTFRSAATWTARTVTSAERAGCAAVRKPEWSTTRWKRTSAAARPAPAPASVPALPRPPFWHPSSSSGATTLSPPTRPLLLRSRMFSCPE